MAKRNTTAGRIVAGTIRREFNECAIGGYDGALRVRSSMVIGALWWVRGDIVHAMTVEGARQTEGIPAIYEIAGLESGTFFYEPGTLPPLRTIRLATATILADQGLWRDAGRATSDVPESDADRALHAWVKSIQSRVPGIESVSIGDRLGLRYSTARDVQSRERLAEFWVGAGADGTAADLRMYRTHVHLLLALGLNDSVLLLEATRFTAPEALLWAAEDAQHVLRGPLVAAAGSSR
ncbi:DUF4388 domain-containing protein [candidate division KSB1 bacterium]|nr:DUF4388 domain-containing protein [candidate division KSB1 bacterium]